MKQEKHKKKKQNLSNPFNISTYAGGEGFFNRTVELEKIDFFLKNTPHSHHLIIIGQRRIGKTSLLRKIQENTDSYIHTVYFDLQDKTDTSIDQLLYELAKKTILDLGKNIHYKNEQLKSPDFFFEVLLKDLIRDYTTDEKLLFLFDEFDVLGTRDGIESDPYIDHLSYNRFIPFIRRWIENIQHENLPIKLILAIGRNYKDLKQERFGGLTKFGINIELNYFKKDDIFNLIEIFSKHSLSFSKEAIDELFTLAAGHPYFSQAIAFEAFTQAVLNKERQIHIKHIQSGFETAIKSVAGGIFWFWEGFSSKQKIVLYILSLLTTKNKELNRENIVKMGEYLLLSPGMDNLSETINQLVALKILLPGLETTLCSGFTVPFFQRWINQELNLQEITALLDKLDDDMELNLKNGHHWYHKKEYNKALEYFEQILSKFPDHFESLYYSGLILSHLSREDQTRLPKAFQYLEAAYRINPARVQDVYESFLLAVKSKREELSDEVKNIVIKTALMKYPNVKTFALYKENKIIMSNTPIDLKSTFQLFTTMLFFKRLKGFFDDLENKKLNCVYFENLDNKGKKNGNTLAIKNIDNNTFLVLLYNGVLNNTFTTDIASIIEGS